MRKRKNKIPPFVKEIPDESRLSRLTNSIDKVISIKHIVIVMVPIQTGFVYHVIDKCVIPGSDINHWLIVASIILGTIFAYIISTAKDNLTLVLWYTTFSTITIGFLFYKIILLTQAIASFTKIGTK